MAIDFNALKQTRKSSFDKLTSELTKMNSNTPQNSNDDDRFWKPDVDKSGNGHAVIRFLPPPGGEDVPFVRIWDHAFQGPGGWYIEKSLTTLGKQDPISEYNSKLWNSGIEANKNQARKQKRNLAYYSNIYVVSDPTRPQNEGKVFLYKYGKKIFDKLNEAMNPEFPDEAPINPFDLWEGANFKLKIRNVAGYRNYDKSEFDKPAPLSQDDDDLKKIWESEHSLQELVDPSKFKSYDELKVRLEKALGNATTIGNSSLDAEEEEAFPVPSKTAAPKEIMSAAAKQAEATWNSTPPWQDSDEDEDLSFFKKLAKD